MLCLLVKKQLNRRSLKEKLHLCKSNTASFRHFNTAFGEISVYTLYSYKNIDKAERRLRQSVPFPLYSCDKKADKEYLEKAVLKKGTEFLKNNKRKTVYLSLSKPTLQELIPLCSYSERLYISFPLSDHETAEIYRLCGTLPVYSALRVPCDQKKKKNYPLNVNLPENLRDICPSDFSHTLFASLIYRENGRFVL